MQVHGTSAGKIDDAVSPAQFHSQLGQPAAASTVPIHLRTQIATLVAGMILDWEQEKATL